MVFSQLHVTTTETERWPSEFVLTGVSPSGPTREQTTEESISTDLACSVAEARNTGALWGENIFKINKANILDILDRWSKGGLCETVQ